MASFEIILGATPIGSPPPSARAPSPENDLFDLVVHGERVSAASASDQAACILRDLVCGATALLEGRSSKVLLPLCDAPWELCLVAARSHILVSLYRTGPLPEIRILDRPVPASELAAQARGALTTMASQLDEAFAVELGALVERLETAAVAPKTRETRGVDTLVRWRSRPADRAGTPRALHAAFETVVGANGLVDGESIRADLHALLFRGRMSFEVRGQRGELAPGFVFLNIERIVSLGRPLLDAWLARRALHLRVAIGNSMLSLRLGTDGRLALTISRDAVATFAAPGIDPREFVLDMADAALALARAAVQCDRARARNLRLRVLRSEARALRRTVNDLERVQTKVNADPAPYRACVTPATTTAPLHPSFDLGRSSRLRYQQRWRAEIEGIDLRGTLLCGDRLVITGARQTVALARASGEEIWARTFARAATTLAGGDLLRLTGQGDVELRDVRDGEVLWSTRITPRSGAPALAFAVSAIGLPRIVILAEGERRLVALDLRTGEPRWRYTARSGNAFKLRRVGRLVLVTSGESAITALDVATGEVVWRYVGQAPFTLIPAVHRDRVLAAAGAPSRGSLRLVAIDAFTGAECWTADHAASVASVPVGAGSLAAVAMTSRDGVQLATHALDDGSLCALTPLGIASIPGGAVALSAFDDVIVANSPTGRVVAFDAERGAIRWTRALPAPVGDDAPRRLDVQLRAGAMFVPQASLAVLRPRDGSVLANADACDLVPDLLRVDEDCVMYVGEESGHVGCYQLGPRLTLVPHEP